MPLPALREELELLPGPPLADGQPSHVLHDPVRNLFFQIDWPTFEILKRWQVGDPATIAEEVGTDTTLELDEGDVEGVLTFLQQNSLIEVAPGSAAELAKRLKSRRGGKLNWMLHHYLFFRIPLVKPDRWLGRQLHRTSFFFSNAFAWTTLAALVLGLYQVARNWDVFVNTLVDTFTWSGLAGYGLALGGVKVLHELGHAFTAKRFGCRVPTMGVAFLVMWPVAYTDVNDAWRLTSKRQRLLVGGAGIITELTVAVWATLAWSLLPEGLPKSMAFLLATTTWISTLVINASPFMRFDGYFLISDWLEMPNLHSRSFALARWDLRERLFALGEPVPETFTSRRHAGLILFAWATWLYRLVLFLGIAVLVYTFFIKAVGILLFVVEIAWFVCMPLWSELKEWGKRREFLRHSSRARRSALLAGVLIATCVLPWPGRLSTSALLRPAEQYVAYAPVHARIAALPVARGQTIEAGTPLLDMSSPELQARREAVMAKLERLRWQTTAGTFDADQRAQWQTLQAQLAAAEAELAVVEADRSRYLPSAPFKGVVADVAPDLATGHWVAKGEPLVTVTSLQGHLAVAYLEESDVARVKVGDKAIFQTDSAVGGAVHLVVKNVDTDATRLLPEPELASLHGGSVTVREKKEGLYPEQAVYRVTLEAVGDVGALKGRNWRGHLTIRGEWSPPAARLMRNLVAVMRREAGF